MTSNNSGQVPSVYMVPVPSHVIECPRCNVSIIIPFIPKELSQEEREFNLAAGIPITPGFWKTLPDRVQCPCGLIIGLIHPTHEGPDDEPCPHEV